MAGGITFKEGDKFGADGESYLLNVTVYSITDLYKMRFTLDNASILYFLYMNEVNKMYLEAKLLYVDHIGNIDKLLHKQFSYCNIAFAKFDGDLAVEGASKTKLSPKNVFLHVFYIDSIDIISKNGNTITYALNMVSVNWFNCVSTLKYSNYGKNKEPILEIIKNIIVDKNLNVDEQSFDKVQTSIKMNYITCGNLNLITAIDYLMSRLYYFYNEKDDSFKFIYYNDLLHKYGLFDMKNTETIIGANTIIASFFGSSVEQVATLTPTTFSSVTNYSNRQLFKSIFNRKQFKYNFNKDVFSEDKLKDEDLLDIYNKNFEFSGEYTGKYKKIFDTDMSFTTRTAYWKNNVLELTYPNMVDAFINDNSLIINTAGSITRRPGTVIVLNVDRGYQERYDDVDDTSKRFRAYEGHWVVMKVFHLILPNETNGKRYTQQVVVSRNFVLDDVSKQYDATKWWNGQVVV